MPSPRLIQQLITALCVAAACSQIHAYDEQALAALGARVTSGAAPGYVQDQLCGNCHLDKYDSYQHVGMARSFNSARAASRIEAFGKVFFHEPSQRYYRITETEGQLTFHRYQHDADGHIINNVDIPVAWVLGSGNRARSYLYQTDWGELFLLPLSWYAETSKWGMSPGFEEANHPGLHRKIERDCMFCHNAYADVPAGSDAQFKEHTFPHKLPHGTGCQRCHGPGAEHISRVVEGKQIDVIQAAIINPAKLDPERRDSVCFQCHMLPSATVVGSRLFDRGAYSFRPGESLTDFMAHMDIAEKGLAQKDRFEINHHAYRLWQSRCYVQSKGELGCISCHDPHVKPASNAFRAEVSHVCTQCHQQPESLHASATDSTAEPCANCHMPTRRTQDVVEVTMTDHRIATGPFDREALVAPVQREVRPIASIELLDFGSPPTNSEAEVYRMIAALRSNRSTAQAEKVLRGLLEQRADVPVIPYIELANAQFSLRQYKQAEATARKVLAKDNQQPAAFKTLGVSLLAQQKLDEAISAFKHSLALQRDPEVHFNLAAAYLTRQDLEPAEAQLDAALALRPNMAGALKFKALILSSKGQQTQARDALKRAIALQPHDFSAYADLMGILRSMGEHAEAERYRELGSRLSQALKVQQDG